MRISRVPYSDARDQILDADVLLFRARGLIWRAIAVAGQSIYTHAAMAGWVEQNGKQRLLCLETTSGGARGENLSELVREWPGVIDVYRSNWRGFPGFDRSGAVDVMFDLTGRRYGTRNLLYAALGHMPFIRFMVRPDMDDDAELPYPPFCSQAVSYALRKGGHVDPVPNTPDHKTEPCHLSRTDFTKYLFTLI